MKKFFAPALLVLALFVLCGFASPPAPSAPASAPATFGSSGAASYPYLIDNFEDANYTKAPEWFSFDNVVLKVVRNTALTAGESLPVGTYSLDVSGSCGKWYVGGMGAMLGIDASKYRAFNIDIYGYGPASGKLKVELYEKDSAGTDIAVDKDYKPLYDDLWVSEIDINWTGWKHFSIPFSSFKLDNPGRGNGTFDPTLSGGSAGLVKMQLIFVANQEVGNIHFNIDNLELGNK